MATFMAFEGHSTIGITPATPCTWTVIGITISALSIKKIFSHFLVKKKKKITVEELFDENLWWK